MQPRFIENEIGSQNSGLPVVQLLLFSSLVGQRDLSRGNNAYFRIKDGQGQPSSVCVHGSSFNFL